MPFINSIFSYEREQDNTSSDKFEYFKECREKKIKEILLNKQKEKNNENISEWKEEMEIYRHWENWNKRHLRYKKVYYFKYISPFTLE